MNRGLPAGLLLLSLSLPLSAQTRVGAATPAPGIGRSPGASALPATPGARSQRPPRQPTQRTSRPRTSRGPIYGAGYGYPYGGVYIDDGSRGPDSAQEVQTESESSYVITVPPSAEKVPPTPRVYDVREDTNGNVEMTPLQPADGPTPKSDTYWLIALESGMIQAANRYSMDGEMLRFTTRKGVPFTVSLAEVDMPFTAQLNNALGRPFIKP